MKTKITLLFLFVFVASFGQIPQTSNLIGEYTFNTDANDSSGNNYNGQTFGGPTLIQDRFGNNNSAYSLDGIDDYIHFDDNMLDEWNVNGEGWIEESFTISFWAKSTVSDTEPMIAFGVDNNGQLYGTSNLYTGMITRFGTQISFNSSNWGWNTSTNKIYDGNWHHYVLVWNYDTAYRQVYIDGILASQLNDGNRRFRIRDKALSIGRERYTNDGSADDPGPYGGTYTGSVDEVRIWNLALSSSEISNLYSYDNTSSNYYPDYGQVYVYQTSDYANDSALGSAYLAVMGAAEVSNDTPPAVTSYTASTVSPYYKFKTGELGNASVDIGASGLDNGAMTLMASGSGSDLDDVLDGLNPINHNGTGQIIVAFPKGSDMTVPTSIQEEFNGVTGGALPYSNSDGYGFWLESGVIHSITLDSPHLGYSEWYIFGRKSFTAIGSKIKFRLVDASGAAPSPSYIDIPRISITEIMYNSSGTDDEWIEIYNATGDLNSPEDVDISGWTVGIPDGSDEYSGEIFTFPSSTTIAAGEYLTIALGSNGDGVFNNDNPFTPDFNNLSGSPSNLDVKDTNDTDNLGDDSGSIVLRPNDFDTASIVYYDDITRPGTDGTGYTYENTYPPNNQVSTSDTGTWQSSFIPGGSPKIKSAEIWDSSLGSSDNLIILNNENIFVAAQDVNINDVTVNAGGSLTILKNSSSSLTINNNFINNGTVILNSDSDEFSSIIVGGSSTGDIVYNRYVNTVGDGEWDLIGSPVDGLSISDFVTTNSSVLATNGSAYAVGYHDNTDDSWTNYTTSTVGGAGNFDTSRGYQMATSSGATMAFTGSIATTDQTQSIINNNGNGSGGRRWNLVANPFPSYLNANTNAHASNNFLSVNASVIDSNYLSIYGWNADGSGYTIYNNTSSATYIAPGQAFFVAAASSTAADLSFTEALQTTTGGDDFISLGLENTSSEFSLYLHEGQDKVATTRFYFDYGLGLGLDPGYDAGAYNPSMALSSRLAEDDQGINMGINAMNIDSFEQTTIPLVINRAAGTAFRISMEDSTIPQGVEVYLEDTQTQVLTNLRNQDFILTPQSDVSGMGRFYLKMSGNSLEVGDIEESYISIYKPSDRDCIVMEGLSNVQSGHVKLFNIMGQEVITQSIKPNESTQNILTSGLESGIYIIKLNADNLILTKKLIIK